MNKNPPANAGDKGSIPGLGRFPPGECAHLDIMQMHGSPAPENPASVTSTLQVMLAALWAINTPGSPARSSLADPGGGRLEQLPYSFKSQFAPY